MGSQLSPTVQYKCGTSVTVVGLSTSSINLVVAQAGKVIIGLASHWSCVTDTVVYPPTGSTAKDREMTTHACPFAAWHYLPLPPFPIMSSHTTKFPISAPQSTDHHSILVKCHSMGLTAIRYGWTAGKTKAVMDVSIQLLPVLILKLGLHGVRRRVHCLFSIC